MYIKFSIPFESPRTSESPQNKKYINPPKSLSLTLVVKIKQEIRTLVKFLIVRESKEIRNKPICITYRSFHILCPKVTGFLKKVF